MSFSFFGILTLPDCLEDISFHVGAKTLSLVQFSLLMVFNDNDDDMCIDGCPKGTASIYMNE